MTEQEEKYTDPQTEEIDAEKVISEAQTEEIEDLTTLFAVRTTINQESNILKQIFYRFRILDVIPDIKAMLVSPLLPGYIFFEAPQKRDVQIAVQGIPHIKGRIVQNIRLSEIKHVLLPRSVTEYLEEGDTVEIISGVFEGARAMVMRMPHDTSSSEEVVVRLLQEETPITIKIHGDYLKLVEKHKEEAEEEPVPQIQVRASPEETYSNLDQALSFDDDFEKEYEEEYAEEKEEEEEKEEDEYEDEWTEYEDEEEDEWAKFDGF
ncbi:MAG: transcription elongation factor Spt5 [Candidatus Lokiarchaeota archaeon]|nr:transcription elongation factor Spt5 [Candidatus Lokiarchaeota archaeon]MBD3201770.1 transcription elongation factor Spt5 [Candidatus Lokiarchaeota archaeon]